MVKFIDERSFKLQGHTNIIKSVSLTSDNKYVVSASFDNLLIVWDLENRCQHCILRGHLSHVYSVSISSDNKYIISGSADTTLRVWNLDSKSQEFILKDIKNQ